MELALALAKAGSSMPARIAMIAITTSSSMSVKPNRDRGWAPSPGDVRVVVIKVCFASILPEKRGAARVGPIVRPFIKIIKKIDVGH